MKIRWFAALLGSILSLLPPVAQAGDAATKEYFVKAAFIYNFIKFIEWPGDKAIAKQSGINICALGESNPMQVAASIFKEASTAQLALNLRHERSAASAPANCHVVFIPAGENGQIAEHLAALKGKPVLTVSEGEEFVARGGMIAFVLVDKKIKLIVNKNAVEAAGLHADAQLLEIALKVIR